MKKILKKDIKGKAGKQLFNSFVGTLKYFKFAAHDRPK